MYTIHEKRQKCNFVLILTSDRYKKKPWVSKILHRVEQKSGNA